LRRLLRMMDRVGRQKRIVVARRPKAVSNHARRSR
jgi:hypothetical protein